MPYHVLSNPANSDALDASPDPSPELGGDAAAVRLRKFRQVLIQFGPAQSLDESGGRWNSDRSMVLLETIEAHDISLLPAYLQALVVRANMTLAECLAYLASDPAWSNG